MAAGYVLHVGYPEQGVIKVGDKVTSKVDYARRSRIVPNHTFTHVLNMALRDVSPPPPSPAFPHPTPGSLTLAYL